MSSEKTQRSRAELERSISNLQNTISALMERLEEEQNARREAEVREAALRSIRPHWNYGAKF